MTKLKLIVIYVICSSLFANPAIVKSKLVKVADGSSAYCNDKADVFHNRHQAYKIRNKDIRIIDENIVVKLDIDFIHCVESLNEIKFNRVNPYDEYTFKNYYLPQGSNTILVNTDWVEMTAYRDGVYKELFKQRIPDDMKVDVSFDIYDFLSQSELTELDKGKKIRVSFDMLLARKINSNLLSDTKSPRSKIMRYGSFRQILTLKKDIDNNKLYVASE